MPTFPPPSPVSPWCLLAWLLKRLETFLLLGRFSRSPSIPAPHSSEAPGPIECPGEGILFFLLPSIFVFVCFPRRWVRRRSSSEGIKQHRRIHYVLAATFPLWPVLTSRCIPCFLSEKRRDSRKGFSGPLSLEGKGMPPSSPPPPTPSVDDTPLRPSA